MSAKHAVAAELAVTEPPVRKSRTARNTRRDASASSEAAQRRKLATLLEETRREDKELSAILHRLEERFL